MIFTLQPINDEICWTSSNHSMSQSADSEIIFRFKFIALLFCVIINFERSYDIGLVVFQLPPHLVLVELQQVLPPRRTSSGPFRGISYSGIQPSNNQYHSSEIGWWWSIGASMMLQVSWRIIRIFPLLENYFQKVLFCFVLFWFFSIQQPCGNFRWLY